MGWQGVPPAPNRSNRPAPAPYFLGGGVDLGGFGWALVGLGPLLPFVSLGLVAAAWARRPPPTRLFSGILSLLGFQPFFGGGVADIGGLATAFVVWPDRPYLMIIFGFPFRELLTSSLSGSFVVDMGASFLLGWRRGRHGWRLGFRTWPSFSRDRRPTATIHRQLPNAVTLVLRVCGVIRHYPSPFS